MADTTENKTYLINVKDNLDVYAQHLIDAEKAAQDFAQENAKLLASQDKNNIEYVKAEAKLKQLNTEVKNSKKNIETATKANQASKGSYDELYQRWKLAQTQLKLLGKTYTTNADGVRVLSAEYQKQSKIVAEAKASLNEFGKGVNDNRLNVGSYGEAIESAFGKISPAMGQAAGGVKMLGNAFKALQANPGVLIIGVIVAHLAALVKAFKSSDSGGTEFAARMEQIKAILDVVRQRLVAVTEAIKHVFKGEWKQAAESFKEAVTGIGDQLKEATKAAYDYAYAVDATMDAESNYISQSADMRNAIAKLEYTAQDRSKSTEERKKALEEAIRLSEEEVKEAKRFAKEKLDNEIAYLAGKAGLQGKEVLAFVRMTDAEQANADQSLKTLRNNNEEKFDEIEKLYAAWIDTDTKFFEENKRNISKYSGFVEEIAKDFAKLKEENLAALQPSVDLVNAEIKRITTVQDYKIKDLQFNKQIAAENAALTADAVKRTEWETEQFLYNQEIKQQAAIEGLSLLSNIVGQQTAAGKAFAIAAATIDTFGAANKALNDPTIPSTIARIAMMSIIILRGIANVKSIVKTNVSGGGAGSAPSVGSATAISSSPAVTHITAPSAGASVLTPSQAPAAALAASQGTGLTADSIAAAIAALPAPRVTVEDINARSADKLQVEVLANI